MIIAGTQGHSTGAKEWPVDSIGSSLWWRYCMSCKMAQVALIQWTHAGGP